jgi:hypothetical protein
MRTHHLKGAKEGRKSLRANKKLVAQMNYDNMTS